MSKKSPILSLNRNSFSFRLIAVVAVIIVTASMALNLYYFWHEKNNLQDNYIQQGQRMAKLLAQNSRLALFTSNPKELNFHIEGIMASYTCRMAALYDLDGRVLFSSENQQFPLAESSRIAMLHEVGAKLVSSPEAFSAPVLFTEGSEQVIIAPAFAANQFSAEELFFEDVKTGTGSVGAESGRRVFGYAVLFPDLSLINKEAADNFIINSLVSLIIVIFSCLVVMTTIKKLTVPLQRLVGEIRIHEGGTGSRDGGMTIPADFSSMIELIRSSYLTIESLKENLEFRVHERTSELNKAIDELKLTQDQLIQSEKMAALGQMLGGLSHEINNAVNFITGALPLLDRNLKSMETPTESRNLTPEEQQQRKRNEQNKTLIVNIKEGARRISELSQNLRVFGYSNSEDFSRTDILPGLAACIGIIRSKYGKKIEVKEGFASNLPEISCNIGQLNQVFMNLLLNAAQSIHEQGTITVKASCADRRLRVAICDTGEGIPPERIGKIFNPFYTTKKIGDGTGLGLSISYTIINKHGGTIDIYSKPGEGTTFEISLPI